MRVTFLGTGTSQGIPIIGSKHPVCLSTDPKDKRLRTSAMVEFGDHCLVIDCGPDFRQQMLANQVEKIDGILFTHEHTDHMIGLDDIRPFYFRQGDIPVYAEAPVLKALEKRFDYIFKIENKYPGAPGVIVHALAGEKFEVANMPITPIRVLHGKLPILGYRIGDFSYITDAKTIPAEEMEKLKGTKILVLNALRIEPHRSHLNLEEALALVQEIKPEKTYFTHISHLLGFHKEVEQKLPENVHLAYDNLKLEL